MRVETWWIVRRVAWESSKVPCYSLHSKAVAAKYKPSTKLPVESLKPGQNRPASGHPLRETMDIKVTRLVTTIGPESWVRATLDRSIAGTLRCGPGKFITSDVTMEDSGDSVTAEIKELAEMGHHDSPPRSRR